MREVVGMSVIHRTGVFGKTSFASRLGGGGLLAALVPALAAAAIVTRSGEPVVLRGDAFPAFLTKPVDRLGIYRYDGANAIWVEIPSQVDERVITDLKQEHSTGCRLPNNPCEYKYVTTGTEGNGLDNDDEVVYMPRDGGSCTDPPWLGVPGTDTESTRYRIKVLDSTTSEQTFLFAYLWKSNHSHEFSSDYVESQPLTSDVTCLNSNDPACQWLLPTAALGMNSLSVAFSGNWSTPRLCLNPDRSQGFCADSQGASRNVVDRIKWHAESTLSESEEGWDTTLCRKFLGLKDGPVRIVRQIMGAQSGRYTVKFDYFYGTWFEQLINLRVHPVSSITASIDHRSIQVPPGTETPSLVFTASHSATSGNLAMDTINVTSPMSVDMGPDDWVQVDFSRGTYFSQFDLLRGFRDAARSAYYHDEATGNAPEDQPYQYGQIGYQFTGKGPNGQTPMTDGDSCLPNETPEADRFNFAAMRRTIVPLPTDTACCGDPPTYFSDEGYALHIQREKPFIVTIRPQTYPNILNCDVPLPTPCAPNPPTVTLDSGGYSTNISSSSLDSCGNPIFGLQLFRGVIPGSYSVLADLGASSSWRDYRVKTGTTYRYVTRAYNADGTLGPQSSEATVAVVDTVPPPALSNVAATAGSKKIIVTWNSWSDQDTQIVKVYMALTSGGTRYVMNGLGSPWGTTSFAIVNLTAGQTYYVSAVAVDASGNESTSAGEIAVTPLP